MKPVIQKLQEYIVSNPPCYGDNDAHSILEMLYCYYHECNGTDNDTVKATFDKLYCKMHGMTLREMDKIIDTVCSLCREHEKTGFIDGIKIGIQMEQELSR